jgi:hypothetical protein
MRKGVTVQEFGGKEFREISRIMGEDYDSEMTYTNVRYFVMKFTKDVAKNLKRHYRTTKTAHEIAHVPSFQIGVIEILQELHITGQL